ncbi:hypothetical protein D3C73_1319500 [compost metagenome]
MPATPGQNSPWAEVLKSAVTNIWASGWVTMGMEPMTPRRPAPLFSTRAKPLSRPRRKVNSPFRSGSSLPPAPVPWGSPVWAMKFGMTRWNFSPS